MKLSLGVFVFLRGFGVRKTGSEDYEIVFLPGGK